MSIKPRVIAVVGPTASGKTGLAIAIAKKFGGEVISADSRQVYRGMDLGTGKVTKREMRGVPHYLLDVASPKKTFTAGEYQKLGKAAIKKIFGKNKLPIVAGGTGLYIDSLLYEYALPEVKPNPTLRKKLASRTPDSLFRELQKLDPRRAADIDRHNPRRLIRALEIALTTKKPIPDIGLFRKNGPYEVLTIGIDPGKKVLQHKISMRLKERLRAGMVAEIKALHEKNGVSWQRLEGLGLEHRYVSRYLRGLITKQEMESTLEKEIVRYAKRQMTWFKRNANTIWIAKPAQGLAFAKRFLKK